MNSGQLNEMQQLAMNYLTMEHSFSLQAQDVAEFIVSNHTTNDLDQEVVANAKFVFASTDDNQFQMGLTLAEMVLLENALGECGMNDGVFFRFASSRFSQLRLSLENN